ncbi:hypothetical protein COO60DRAFT_1535942 [Scenedesmus sp. NREL 46B-D3]|nr:hypothetical protein COO60DRAFT_1535942 [Scenedesmus sp. NREL 46B-D3]
MQGVELAHNHWCLKVLVNLCRVVAMTCCVTASKCFSLLLVFKSLAHKMHQSQRELLSACLAACSHIRACSSLRLRTTSLAPDDCWQAVLGWARISPCWFPVGGLLLAGGLCCLLCGCMLSSHCVAASSAEASCISVAQHCTV